MRGRARTSGCRAAGARSPRTAGGAAASSGTRCTGLVVDGREQVGDHVEPRPALVVALDDPPRRLGDVGVHHHLVLGPRVVLPAGDRLQVHRRELPAAHRVLEPGRGTGASCSASLTENQYLRSRMPSSTSSRSKIGHWCRNRWYSSLRAEAHHPLDAGPVVPGAVEQHDLAGGRQLVDVALEVPLAALAVARCRQRGDPGDAGVEVLGDPLDRAALAGRVATLEDHDDQARPRSAPTPAS